MVRVLVPRQFQVLFLSCPLLPLFTQNFALWGKCSNKGSDNCSELCHEGTTCSEEISYTGRGTNVPEWQGKTFTMYRISQSYRICRHASCCDGSEESFFAVRPVAATVLYGSNILHIAFTLRQLTLGEKKGLFLRNIERSLKVYSQGKLRLCLKAVAVTLLFIYLPIQLSIVIYYPVYKIIYTISIRTFSKQCCCTSALCLQGRHLSRCFPTILVTGVAKIYHVQQGA